MTWDVLMAYGWGTVASVVLVLVGTGLDIEAGRWWAERRKRRQAAAEARNRERVTAALFGPRPRRKA